MHKEENYHFEAKKEILKSHLDILLRSISGKFDTLATISGLAATLLVIATFNEVLLTMTFFVRILIAVLLALMPLSLLFRLLELNEAGKSALKGIDDVTGLDSIEIMKQKSEGRGRLWFVYNRMIAYSPFVIFGVFTFVVVMIICLIFL